MGTMLMELKSSETNTASRILIDGSNSMDDTYGYLHTIVVCVLQLYVILELLHSSMI